jgi:peroxiredoxin
MEIIVISLILLWTVVIFNLVMTLALIRRINSSSLTNLAGEKKMLKTGTEAPDFTIEDLNGTTVSKRDYTHNELAMVFIAPNCQPCSEQLPILEELYTKAKLAGVELAIVSIADKTETRLYVEESGFKVPVLVAPRYKNSFPEDYKVQGTPSYCLIDRNGKVKSAGFLDEKWRKITDQWRETANNNIKPSFQGGDRMN